MPSTGAPDVGSRSSQPTRAPARPPDVRFEPSPPEVVDAMLRLAAVGPDDVVFDLGCGDGRIVIAAVAELGARRGVCVEIDPALVARARHAARRAGVEERIDFVEGDLFAADLSDATVVALFLFPDVNLRLRPRLLGQLAPGTRVVSHEHDMGDWRPEKVLEVDGHRIYLWTIPPRDEPPP